MKRVLLAALLLAALPVGVSESQAAAFNCITNNSGSCSTVAPQLGLAVSDDGGNVLFQITNAGPISSSIAYVLLDDDSGLLTSVWDYQGDPAWNSQTKTGVNFTRDDSRALPGGNVVGFVTDYGFVATAPPSKTGVNPPSELLNVWFTPAAGADAADILDAIAKGTLVVGLHVTSIDLPLDGSDTTYSESFVTKDAVPEPASLLLLGTGLLGTGYAARRRKK